MKRFPLLMLLLAAVSAATRAVVTNNIPISALPLTTSVVDTAVFPLVQPYPGRSTGDTFKATVATLFSGRSGGTFTNVTIQNINVTSNLTSTNITLVEDHSTNYYIGGTYIFTNSSVTFNGTNLATINPTIGRIPYNLDGTNLADSALYYIDTNTVGAQEIDTAVLQITGLTTNTLLTLQDIAGIATLTNIANGTGALTNDGAGNFGWFDISNVGHWTYTGGYLQPTDLTQPLFWTNSVTWGPGTTNSLTRSGVDLLYTNSTTTARFGIGVVNGSGQTAYYGTHGNVAEISHAATIDLIANSKDLRWWNNTLTPLQAASELGHNGGGQYPWGDFKMQGTEYIYGFNPDVSDSSNYSRAAFYHTGTNGAVVFDSQAAGSAGGPRNFNFDWGGTNKLTVARDPGNAQRIQVYNPEANYLEIGDGVNASTFVVEENTTDNVFFGAGGTVALTTGAIPSDPFSDRRFEAHSTTSASAATQVPSPSFLWIGQGWSTNAAASVGIGVAAFMQTEAGLNSPLGELVFRGSIGSTNGVAQISMSTEGSLFLGSMTKAQKTALVNVKNGALVYQTDNTPGLRAYINGAWVIVNTSADP